MGDLMEIEYTNYLGYAQVIMIIIKSMFGN